MTQVGRIHQGSVIVDGSRTIHDLITTIAIQVAYRNIMGTLCIGCSLATRLGGCLSILVGHRPLTAASRGVEPVGRECVAVEIDSPEISTGVVTTTHHGTWSLVKTIEMSHASQVTLTTVVWHIFISPVGAIFTYATIAHATVRIIINGMDGLAGLSIEHSEQLLAP